MKHAPSHRPRALRRTPTIATTLLALGAAVVSLIAPAVSSGAAASTGAPTVSSINVRSGGTWGYDLVTVRGTNFTGVSNVAAVLFGAKAADGFSVLNSTTIQVYSPDVANRRQVVDVRVVLGNGAKSAAVAADRFTYVVPTMDTRLNGGWSARQSQQVSNSLISSVNPHTYMSPNPGYWTPGMGASAVRRAARWLGMPYTWAGGNAYGPSYGACYGDGLIGKFDCTFRGFDCSGLTLYAWSPYLWLDHYAQSQKYQAGRFHPTLSELQPGDLLFLSNGSSTASHVTMYAGNGNVIQSSLSGYPVRYTSLTDSLASHSRYLGATRPMSTGAQGSAPTVSSVSVTRSAVGGGSTITVHGSHFDTTSRVYFGSAYTYGFSVSSSTTLTAKIPAHPAGRVNVRVGNAWGVSPTTTRDQMTYIAPPTLASSTPSRGSTSGGTRVTLTGSGFSTGAKVYFGSRLASSVRVLSDTTLSVVTPASGAGSVATTIVTGYGSTRRTVFAYLDPPAPSPTATPSTSPGTSPTATPSASPSTDPVPSSTDPSASPSTDPVPSSTDPSASPSTDPVPSSSVPVSP